MGVQKIRNTIDKSEARWIDIQEGEAVCQYRTSVEYELRESVTTVELELQDVQFEIERLQQVRRRIEDDLSALVDQLRAQIAFN
jgi:hypothetical protein